MAVMGCLLAEEPELIPVEELNLVAKTGRFYCGPGPRSRIVPLNEVTWTVDLPLLKRPWRNLPGGSRRKELPKGIGRNGRLLSIRPCTARAVTSKLAFDVVRISIGEL